MTRLLGFDPFQRATEFICRLMLEVPGCPSMYIRRHTAVGKSRRAEKAYPRGLAAMAYDGLQAER